MLGTFVDTHDSYSKAPNFPSFVRSGFGFFAFFFFWGVVVVETGPRIEPESNQRTGPVAGCLDGFTKRYLSRGDDDTNRGCAKVA